MHMCQLEPLSELLRLIIDGGDIMKYYQVLFFYHLFLFLFLFFEIIFTHFFFFSQDQTCV